MSELRLGAFVLDDPIGKGGMGEVWRGHHAATGLPVAVKMIKPEFAPEGRFKAAFLREVESVAALDHPGVVLVFDHGEVDAEQCSESGGILQVGEPYLVTEFASGGSLDQRGRPRSWGPLRGLLLALLDALGHAHAHGVIHLDLKPGNLLRCTRADFRPGLKLTDFGLAQVLAEVRQQTRRKAAGTPQYMAPEQFSRDGSLIGPWSDLYAVGCIAWELATGGRVFPYQAVADLMRGHLHEQPGAMSPLFAVPAGFEEWVRICLAKAPSERFGVAADAAWAIMGLGEPVDFDRTTVDLAQNEAPTFTFTTLASMDTAELPEIPSEEAVARTWGKPPMPRDWRTPLVERPLRLLDDAGSGLFGLRTVPFVGREALRDRLWEALGQVRSTGLATAIVLHGPPGVGKTRLARWLGRRASELGSARFYEARYAENDAGIAELLARDFSEGVDNARDRIPRLQAALCRVDRPAVLVLDEAEREAEATSLARRLLRYREAAPCPVLLILTTEQLDRSLQRLLGMKAAIEIQVPPLDDRECSALLRGLLALERALAGLVETRSGGNPEYAIQLVGDWLRRGLLRSSPMGFVLAEGTDVRLPESLRQVWSERMEPLLAVLDAGEVTSLTIAAILGASVRQEEWEAACEEASVEALDGGLEELLHQGLLRRTDEGWAFPETLVRELLLERAREHEDWTGLHASCAGVDDLDAERRGLFLDEAGDLEGSIEPLTEAAKARCHGLAFERSIFLVDRAERALDALSVAPADLRRYELKRRRMVCRMNSWDFSKVRGMSEGFLAEAEEHGWPTRDFHGVLATHLSLAGDLEAATRHAEASLASPDLDPQQRAQAISIRGQVAMAAREYKLCMDLTLEAKRILDEVDEGDTFARARNLNDLGEACRLLKDYAAAAEYYGEAVRICREIDQGSLLVSLVNLALVHIQKREWEPARELLTGVVSEAGRQMAIYPDVYARVLLLEVAAATVDLPLWDQNVHGLKPRYEAQPFYDNDMPESLMRGGRRMCELAPARARYALELAELMFRKVGRDEDAEGAALLLRLLPRDSTS